MQNATLKQVAKVLLIIGGLNWGLIGFFEYDLVGEIFSVDVSRVIYAIVGLAAVYFGLAILQSKMSDKK